MTFDPTFDVQPGDPVTFDTDVGLLVTEIVRGAALDVGDVIVVAYPYPTVTQEDLDSLAGEMEVDLQQVTKPYGQFAEDLPPGRDRNHSYTCLFVRHLEREHRWNPDGYWEDEGFHRYARATLFHKVVRTDSVELAELIVAWRLAAGHGRRDVAGLLIDRAAA